MLVRASDVEDLGNGIYRVYLEGRPLTDEQAKVLSQLFPNTIGAAELLLDKEALLAAIVPESEVLDATRKAGKPVKEEPLLRAKAKYATSGPVEVAVAPPNSY